MPEYQNPVIDQSFVDSQSASDAAASGIAGTPTVAKLPSTFRTFVSPVEPNTRFLVIPGVMSQPLVAGGQVVKWPERVGDKWATFVNGVCTTDDQDVISWLDAHAGNQERHARWYQEHNQTFQTLPHYGFCRDINTPGVEGWAELKANQQPLSHRPASISPGLDVDKLFAGQAADMPRDPQSQSQTLLTSARNVQDVMDARKVMSDAYKDPN